MKRATGVYYTPGDVARTMVKELFSGRLTSTIRILDPACGTGVFLIAALAYLRAEAPATLAHLDSLPVFGLDKSALAIDLCGFAVMPTLQSLFPTVQPIALLRAFRRNLAIAESPAISDSSHVLPFAGTTADAATELRRAFPHLAGEFNFVVTNPPYTRTRTSDGGTLYLAFLRLATRIVKPNGGAFALVLPLTIAFSQSREFAEARHELASGEGTLRFAFFDREPGGLFGEEVKTRAAFVFRHYSGQGGAAEVFTSPLLRFTSRTRSAMLRELPAVSLDRWPIYSGIPRIGSASESAAYRSVRSRCVTLASRVQLNGTSWTELADSPGGGCVLVGGVAYNFLNVFMTPFARPSVVVPPSESKIHAVTSTGVIDDFGFYAYLASSLPFWLWTIDGDGFHVGSKFIQGLPWTSKLDESAIAKVLSELGKELWLKSTATPVVSINKQKWSLGFHSRRAFDELKAIDDVICAAFEVPAAVRDEMRDKLQKRVVIDANDPARVRMMRSGNKDD